MPLPRGAQWAGVAASDLEPLAPGVTAAEGMLSFLGMVPSYVQLCLLDVLLQ